MFTSTRLSSSSSGMASSSWKITDRIFDLQRDFFTSYNYRVTKVLGLGAAGQVFLAKSNAGDQDVAVKRVVRDKALRAHAHHFVSEATALCNMKHHRLVQMQMLAKCPDYFYIVMDVCPNGNLQNYIPRLNVHKTCDFIVDIASAVHYLHKNLVIHRDIKPNNILIDATGHAVLADLGMAQKRIKLTTTNAFGNDAYRAPELRVDELLLEPFCPFKAEMFTVGVIFWMMAMKEKRAAVDGDFVKRMNRKSGEIPYFMRKAIQNLLSTDPASRRSSTELLNKLYQDMPPYAEIIKEELGSDLAMSE